MGNPNPFDPLNLQENIKKSLQTMTDLSGTITSTLIDSGIKTAQDIGAALKGISCPECREAAGHSDVKNYICPPPDVCPPRCMITLRRSAHRGDIFTVAFGIKNPAAYPRKYQVGVRPFVDPDGNQAPIAAQLDKTEVEIMPDKHVVVKLRLGIPENLPADGVYQTDIVVREKKYNQNICLTLNIDTYTNVPVATPIEEKYIDYHFHRWHHHFYCTPGARRAAGIDPAAVESAKETISGSAHLAAMYPESDK